MQSLGARARRAGGAAVRLHPRATSITGASSGRSTCARSRRSATLQGPGGRASPEGGAVPRRMVGAAADGGSCARAAAPALARIGTPEARGVLEEAAASGSRGVRAAARAHWPAPARRARRSARAVVDDDAPRSSSPTNCSAASPRRCDRDSSTRRAIRSSRATWRRSPRPIQQLHATQPTHRHRHRRRRDHRRRHAGRRRRTRSAAWSRRLKQIGVERITIDRGVTRDEIATLVDAVTTLEVEADERAAAVSRRCRTSASAASPSSSGSRRDAADMATFRRLYTEAVSVAEAVWESAQDRRAARRDRRARR